MKFSCAIVSSFVAFTVAQQPQNKSAQGLLAVNETDIIPPGALLMSSFPKSFVFEVYTDENCTTAVQSTERYPILTCHQLVANPNQNWVLLDWEPEDLPSKNYKSFRIKQFGTDRDCLNYLNFKIYRGSTEPSEATVKSGLLPKTEVFLPYETCTDGKTKFELKDGRKKYYKVSKFSYDMYALGNNGTKIPELLEIEKNINAPIINTEPRIFGQISSIDKILMFEKPQNCVLKYLCQECKCNTTSFVTESKCFREKEDAFYRGTPPKNPGVSDQWVCEGNDNAMTCAQKPTATNPTQSIMIKNVRCTADQLNDMTIEPCFPQDATCKAPPIATTPTGTPTASPTGGNSNSLTVSMLLLPFLYLSQTFF